MKQTAIFVIKLLMFVAFIGISGMGLAGGVKAPPKPTLSEAAVDSRLKNLTNLINTSGAAKRVQASPDETALAKHAEAKSLLEEAHALNQKGDLAQADTMLSQATKSMFEAIRLVSSSTSEKK